MKKLLFVLFLLVSNVISAQDIASVEIDTTFKRTETDLDKIQSKFKSFYEKFDFYELFYFVFGV